MRSCFRLAAWRLLHLPALAVALGASSAMAAPVTATYTGEIVSLVQPGGLLAGTLGPGSAVSATVNFDDALSGVTLDSAPQILSASGALSFGGLSYAVTGLRVWGASVPGAPGVPDWWSLTIQAEGPEIAGANFWGMLWYLDGSLRRFVGDPPLVPQQAAWCLPFGNGGCANQIANLAGDLLVEPAHVSEAPTLPLVALALALLAAGAQRRRSTRPLR